MPFTGSHPAAVLPLTYLGLSTPALVIGSLSPDLPYYLPGLPDSALTHSALGVVTVNPVIGLACLALWHALVAPLALAVAPAGARRRIRLAPRARRRRPRRADVATLLLLMVALSLGSATHVLWDEFTHSGRFGARHLDWLATQHGALPGYRWAQYASGLLGAAVLAAALWRWWRTADLTPDPGSALPRRTVAAVWAVVTLSTVTGAATAVTAAVTGDQGVRRALFLVATWGGGAGLLAVVVAAVACAPRIARSRTRRVAAGTGST